MEPPSKKSKMNFLISPLVDGISQQKDNSSCTTIASSCTIHHSGIIPDITDNTATRSDKTATSAITPIATPINCPITSTTSTIATKNINSTKSTNINHNNVTISSILPECRIIVHNVAKKKNIGMLIRSAVAFGVSQIIIVGSRKIMTHGHQNTSRYIRFEYFEKLKDCAAYLKDNNFTIYGVEIGNQSEDVTSHPFVGNSAFIFGNEGVGMSKAAIDICDKLVYIPQYGHGTASLNVSVAASIVIHHFALWAKYYPTCMKGAKFVVDESKKIEKHMFSSSLWHQKKILERKQKKQKMQQNT